MAYRRSYRRFSRSRRAPMKRRTTYRKKTFSRKRVAPRGFLSSTGNDRGLRLTGFRNKHIPYRSWLRNTIRATDNQQHFRTLQTLAAPITTGAVTGTWVGYRFALSQLFWTTGGGYQNQDVSGAVIFPGDLFIRGGKYECIISNPASAVNVVEVTTWMATTKLKPVFGAIAARTTLDPAWDPSADADFQSLWSFGKPVVTVLKPGETCSRVEFQSGQKIDQQLYNTDGCQRKMWVFKFVNLTVAAATTLTIETRHNVSFTGDMTAP